MVTETIRASNFITYMHFDVYVINNVVDDDDDDNDGDDAGVGDDDDDMRTTLSHFRGVNTLNIVFHCLNGVLVSLM